MPKWQYIYRKRFYNQKKILSESEDEQERNKKEPEFIREYGANDPNIGYNQWPKFKP